MPTITQALVPVSCPSHPLITPRGLFCGLYFPDFSVAGTVVISLSPSGFWLFTLGPSPTSLILLFLPSLLSSLHFGAEAMVLCYLLLVHVCGFSLHDEDSWPISLPVLMLPVSSIELGLHLLQLWVYMGISLPSYFVLSLSSLSDSSLFTLLN